MSRTMRGRVMAAVSVMACVGAWAMLQPLGATPDFYSCTIMDCTARISVARRHWPPRLDD